MSLILRSHKVNWAGHYILLKLKLNTVFLKKLLIWNEEKIELERKKVNLDKLWKTFEKKSPSAKKENFVSLLRTKLLEIRGSRIG